MSVSVCPGRWNDVEMENAISAARKIVTSTCNERHTSCFYVPLASYGQRCGLFCDYSNMLLCGGYNYDSTVGGLV